MSRIRTLLNNSKIAKPNILAFLKQNTQPEHYRRTINRYPILKRIKSRQRILRSKSELSIRALFQETHDFKKEVYWVMYDIIEESDLINAFLKSKLLFERAFLLGDYKTAEATLQQIENEIGYSLWLIEMKLLLEEKSKGTKENWQLQSSLLEDIKSNFYRTFISHFSKRVEENMSFKNYLNQFELEINSLDINESLKDFVVFNVLYNAEYDYTDSDLSSVLYQSVRLGVVDQYLILVNVILRRLSANNINEDKLLLEVVDYLRSFINDDRLQNATQLLGGSFFDPSEEDLFIINVIELYSKGCYTDAIQEASTLLKSYPDKFELHELYIKSIISINSKDFKTGISDNIDQILESLYQMLKYEKNIISSANYLLKLSNTYTSFNLGRQLASFHDYIHEANSNLIIAGLLSSSFLNPRLLSQSHIVAERYKDDIFKDSKDVNLYISGVPNSWYETSDSAHKEIYHIKHLYAKEQHSDVISFISTINQDTLSPFHFAELVKCLLPSYWEVGQFTEAVIFCSKLFFDKPEIFNIINISYVVEKIKGETSDELKKLIDVPILASFHLSEYKLYVMYDEFMRNLGNIDRPSIINIDEFINQHSLNKVIFFLERVCTIPTIRYSLTFRSLNEVEQERISICKILKEINKAKSKDYDAEISDIIRIGAIRQAIKEVDNSRLHVNIEGLRKISKIELEESFLRYKNIEVFTKEHDIKGFNINEMHLSIENDLEQEYGITEDIDSPDFLAFRSMFYDLRDRFLFSKEYGLDSYLSTRIRHGALKNHIRSVFEKHKLVTSKTGEIYVDSTYWTRYLNDFDIEAGVINNIQQIIKELSAKIDAKAAYLVDNLIQIKTEKNNTKSQALFDFSTPDQNLWFFYNEYKDKFHRVDNLVELVLRELSAVVSLSLSNHVRTYLDTTLKDYYLECIDAAKNKLKALNLDSKIDLFVNLSNASTDIQVELNKIMDWFIFRTTDSTSLIDFDILINASKDYTNKINPTNQIDLKLEQKIGSDNNVVTSIQMFHVLNILLNNVIKHNGDYKGNIPVEISLTKSTADFLKITCKNPVSDTLDISNARNKLDLIKSGWRDKSNIDRSTEEGESGFDKIKRIFFYELNVQNSEFDYCITEQNVSISLLLPFQQNK